MPEDLIPPEAKAMIGSSMGSGTLVIDGRQARKWAAAVDDRNPIYWDEDAAKAAGYRTTPIPPMFLGQTGGDVTFLENLNLDGTPKSSGSGPEIPLPVQRKMAGGTETEYLEPIYPGDVLTTETRLTNLEQKEGRSGSFVLIHRETTYTNQDGVLVARSHGTAIQR